MSCVKFEMVELRKRQRSFQHPTPSPSSKIFCVYHWWQVFITTLYIGLASRLFFILQGFKRKSESGKSRKSQITLVSFSFPPPPLALLDYQICKKNFQFIPHVANILPITNACFVFFCFCLFC